MIGADSLLLCKGHLCLIVLFSSFFQSTILLYFSPHFFEFSSLGSVMFPHLVSECWLLMCKENSLLLLRVSHELIFIHFPSFLFHSFLIFFSHLDFSSIKLRSKLSFLQFTQASLQIFSLLPFSKTPDSDIATK